MSFHKILVALDFAAFDTAVFEEAVAIAQAMQARLMLLHCLAPDTLTPPRMPIPMEVGLRPSLMDSAYEAYQHQTQERMEGDRHLLQSYCDRAQQAGIATEFDQRIGDPGPTICEAARMWDADLVIVGRRGRSGLAEVLLGSVSNYVVHHAQRSVLVVQMLESTQETPASQAAPGTP